MSKGNTVYTTNQKRASLSILQRIAETDEAAIEDCVDVYGSLVWALARKHTDSITEASAATQEIFLDIWRCAARFDSMKLDEAAFIFFVARRRLIKRSLKPTISATTPIVKDTDWNISLARFNEN